MKKSIPLSLLALASLLPRCGSVPSQTSDVASDERTVPCDSVAGSVCQELSNAATRSTPTKKYTFSVDAFATRAQKKDLTAQIGQLWLIAPSAIVADPIPFMSAAPYNVQFQFPVVTTEVQTREQYWKDCGPFGLDKCRAWREGQRNPVNIRLEFLDNGVPFTGAIELPQFSYVTSDWTDKPNNVKFPGIQFIMQPRVGVIDMNILPNAFMSITHGGRTLHKEVRFFTGNGRLDRIGSLAPNVLHNITVRATRTGAGVAALLPFTITFTP